MFTNIGGKIKGWAKVLCYLGIAVSVIMGIAIIVAGDSMGRYGYYGSGVSIGGVLGGLLVAVIGGFASWIGSFLLYGFGELIDSCNAIEHRLGQMPVDNPPTQHGASQDAGGSAAE